MTLHQALKQARTDPKSNAHRAAQLLHGRPIGGWAETRQSMWQVRNMLPVRWTRATCDRFVSAVYYTDTATQRLRTRAEYRDVGC